MAARATLYLPTSQLGRPGCLAWAQVASLPRDLVEIGGHAHVHRIPRHGPGADVSRLGGKKVPS